MFFFFFQAEDGIRDKLVTGVQTCALPICEPLRDRVERAGPLPPRLAMKLLQEVAWALGSAHQRGVIHRDVKPDNIMIERATERARVTDFGIALCRRGGAGAGAGGGAPVGRAP